jgi:transmembrane sensor
MAILRTHRSDANQAIAEEAARWVVELEESRPGDLAEFAAWLTASPSHVEEFLVASALWRELDHIDPERRVRVEELIALASRNVQHLEGAVEPRAAHDRTRRTRWALALVCVAASVAVLFVLLMPTGSRTYATARGEQRTFKLDDGSIVALNTQSSIEVSYSAEARTLKLLAGEALFTVEHDARRPFRVIADDAVIQAIGTQFNVYRSDAGTTVSVVEGVVEIKRIDPTASAAVPAMNHGDTHSQLNISQVTAGERVQVLAHGEVVRGPVSDLASVTAWRDRRLVFRGEPLATIAEEFNRYNTVQIHVDGELTRNRRLTGVFAADDPHSLLLFLKEDVQLDINADDRDVWIRGP